MALKRKQVRVSPERAAKMTNFARLSEQSLSAVGAEWVHAYLAHGTEAQPTPETVKLQIFLPEEVIAELDAQLEADGLTLQDIFEHEIDEIDRL